MRTCQFIILYKFGALNHNHISEESDNYFLFLLIKRNAKKLKTEVY